MVEPAQPGRRSAWLAPAIPALLSLALSLSTVGTRVWWQDSGLYLAAVKDLGVLYPPGFTLYLLACKAWTLLFCFLDFTLAVHLFSAACAAAAAAAVAAATRELLGARGRLFGVHEAPGGPLNDVCAASAGVLAACGYTFWSSAIYAKGYALYYLILALLMRQMIRCEEAGGRRHFRILALLIGLAWAVHPSAAGLAVVLVLFVARHARRLGGRAVVEGIGISAGAALGPVLLLPLLASGDSPISMGDPTSAGELVRYAVGQRYVTVPGVFGWDSLRALTGRQFLWEEFLGIGLALVTVGIAGIGLRKRALLAGVAAWTVPYFILSILFKMEGQLDHWLVAAWMPLYVLGGLGLATLCRPAGLRSPWIAAAVGTVSAAWAVAANVADLNQRNYTLPETYGRIFLQTPDEGAILLVHSDDALAMTGYLQRVRGERPDLLVVAAPYLGTPGAGGRLWYDQKLARKNPGIAIPDYSRLPLHALGGKGEAASALFVNENLDRGRPLFLQAMPSPELLRDDCILVPAGVLWRAMRRDREQVDARHWKLPLEPEQLVGRFGRKRGQANRYEPEGVRGHPQSYEERLFRLLLLARERWAAVELRRKNYAAALPILEAIPRFDPEAAEDPSHLYALGLCYAETGREDRAELLFLRLLQRDLPPDARAGTHAYLARILRKRGLAQAARAHEEAAWASPDLDPELRAELEKHRRR